MANRHDRSIQIHDPLIVVDEHRERPSIRLPSPYYIAQTFSPMASRER
jgi:hypothetical protein